MSAADMIPGSEHPTMKAIREYVTANDETRYDFVPEGFLRINVTHSNLKQKWPDLLFHQEMTVGEVKDKLYKHGGTPAAFMELFLRRAPGDTIFLADERHTLRDYGVWHGMEIHIKDTDPHSLSRDGGLENVDLVEKYEISEDAYNAREKTFRKFKEEKLAADPNWKLVPKADGSPPDRPETPRNAPQIYVVGERCEVNPGARRGVVKYLGRVDGLTGTWVGVDLDEPQGSNDGSRKDKLYFECKGERYGCFARCENVNVGDYPERDPFDFSDDEI